MIITKHCTRCGQPFPVDSHYHWKQYCSLRCNQEAYRERKGAAVPAHDVLAKVDTGTPVALSLAMFPEWNSSACCCYGWFRKDHYLYIGQAPAGITRRFPHKVIGKQAPLYTTDQLHFWHSTPEGLDLLERGLIRHYQPVFNIRLYEGQPTLLQTTPDHVADCSYKCAHPFCRKPFVPSGRGNFRLYCSAYCRQDHPAVELAAQEDEQAIARYMATINPPVG